MFAIGPGVSGESFLVLLGSINGSVLSSLARFLDGLHHQFEFR